MKQSTKREKQRGWIKIENKRERENEGRPGNKGEKSNESESRKIGRLNDQEM